MLSPALTADLLPSLPCPALPALPWLSTCLLPSFPPVPCLPCPPLPSADPPAGRLTTSSQPRSWPRCASRRASTLPPCPVSPAGCAAGCTALPVAPHCLLHCTACAPDPCRICLSALLLPPFCCCICLLALLLACSLLSHQRSSPCCPLFCPHLPLCPALALPSFCPCSALIHSLPLCCPQTRSLTSSWGWAAGRGPSLAPLEASWRRRSGEQAGGRCDSAAGSTPAMLCACLHCHVAPPTWRLLCHLSRAASPTPPQPTPCLLASHLALRHPPCAGLCTTWPPAGAWTAWCGSLCGGWRGSRRRRSQSPHTPRAPCTTASPSPSTSRWQTAWVSGAGGRPGGQEGG